jgi:hypothetical protein
MRTLAQRGIGFDVDMPQNNGCFNYKTRAGIELELEGIDIDEVECPFNWRAVSDGSLRNNGIEFITNGGFAGEDLEEALDNLQDYLDGEDYDVTERCSTHIHIDVRDMTPAQITNFLCLSVMLEHVLFNLFGNTRTANTFCIATDGGSTNFDNIVNSINNPESLIDYTWSKYAAIGLKRIRDLGTVEFRMFKAITEKAQYVQVLNVLFAMKRMAKDMFSPSALVDFKLQHNTSEIIQVYMPDVAYAPEFDDLLERGIQTLNDIITAAEVVRIVEEKRRKYDTIIETARQQRRVASRGI